VLDNPKPKIVFLDIETRPATVYSWGMHEQNHTIDQIIDPGGTICFGAAWLHTSKVEFYSDWEHGHQQMIGQAHRLFTEADAVCTFNGDRFDIPKLKGEMLLNGFPPPPPLTSIDVYKTIRKMGFLSGKLGFVSPLLGLAGKEKHDGFAMWKGVMSGERKHQRMMRKYCIGDVRELKELYLKIRPYVENHPHMGTTGPLQCPSCSSHQVISQGSRRTRTQFVQRHQCRVCGAWFQGKRTKAA
jgi:hypothetical protein